ncbi:hypothetical protein QFZ52_002280 [Arthrobacter woluwensis]|nr:hypothetical protein [Arthrobacter woluwensis]
MDSAWKGPGAAPLTVRGIPLPHWVDPLPIVLCREKTRLVQRIEDNLARYLTTAVEQRSAELAKLKTFREEAAVRASALTKWQSASCDAPGHSTGALYPRQPCSTSIDLAGTATFERAASDPLHSRPEVSSTGVQEAE